jgi:1,6-anhydro-N-acetylmuramate kinase
MCNPSSSSILAARTLRHMPSLSITGETRGANDPRRYVVRGGATYHDTDHVQLDKTSRR